MTTESNACAHLLTVMQATTPPHAQYVHVERALAITVVVLLILAGLAFAKIGSLSPQVSERMGFAFIGLAGSIVLAKVVLLSLQCCKSSILINAHTVHTCDPNARITPEQRNNARPAYPS